MSSVSTATPRSTAAPRRLSAPRAGAVVAAVAACVSAVVIFVIAVRTSTGQYVNQRVLEYARELPSVTPMPVGLRVPIVSNPLLWTLGAVAVVALVQSGTILCRRSPSGWGRRASSTALLLLFPPAAILVVRALRDGLPRPQLHEWIAETANSAPSGHAAAVTSLVAVLVLAAPPVLRPAVAAIGGTWSAVICFGLVASGWHRPGDVLISALLVVGAAVLLPDPHRASTTPMPRGTWIAVAAVITLAAPTILALYYPRPEQVVIAAAIALGVGLSLGTLVGVTDGARSPARMRSLSWGGVRHSDHVVPLGFEFDAHQGDRVVTRDSRP